RPAQELRAEPASERPDANGSTVAPPAPLEMDLPRPGPTPAAAPLAAPVTTGARRAKAQESPVTGSPRVAPASSDPKPEAGSTISLMDELSEAARTQARSSLTEPTTPATKSDEPAPLAPARTT